MDSYPNWYRTHTIPKFGFQSSWITGARQYTQQLQVHATTPDSNGLIASMLTIKTTQRQ